jgi:hypothetical protein
MQRTRRYWYEDGFADLAMGGYLLALGLFFAAESLTPQGSPLWLLWGTGGPLLLIGGGFIASRIVQQLKAEHTYPRTGYVSFERKGISRVAQLLGTMVMAGLVAAGIVVVARGWQNLTLLFGIVFAAVFGYIGYRMGLTRYFLFAAWGLLVGLGSMLFPLTLDQGSAVFFVAFGLAMMIVGWMVWYRYNASAPHAGGE